MLTRFCKLGFMGAAVFLLAIAPLGVGSAFPFSLIAVAGLYVLSREQPRIDARLPEVAAR